MPARLLALFLVVVLSLGLSGCGTYNSVANNPGCGPAFGGTAMAFSGVTTSGFPLIILDVIDLPLSLVGDILILPCVLLDGE